MLYVSSCWEIKCSGLIWAIFVGHLVGQTGYVSKDLVTAFCFGNLYQGHSWRNLEKISDVMSIFILTSCFSFLEKYKVQHLRFRNWLIWCLVRKQFCAVNVCCWNFDDPSEIPGQAFFKSGRNKINNFISLLPSAAYLKMGS